MHAVEYSLAISRSYADVSTISGLLHLICRTFQPGVTVAYYPERSGPPAGPSPSTLPAEMRVNGSFLNSETCNADLGGLSPTQGNCDR
jgi:hypothetical protein